MSRIRLSVAAATLAATLALPNAAHAHPAPKQCAQANESGLQLRGQHKVRDAVAELVICMSRSCRNEVRSECERNLTAMKAAELTLVFEAKDPDGADPTAPSQP